MEQDEKEEACGCGCENNSDDGCGCNNESEEQCGCQDGEKCDCDGNLSETKELLQSVNSGCKSATSSMEQVLQYVHDSQLEQLITLCNREHIAIGDECHELLNRINEEEKDPPAMAKVFSWLSTEVKMTIEDDNHQIAKIMMDGCNMGIQSLCEYINKYEKASQDSKKLARRLVAVEEKFMVDLKKYL